VKLLTLRSNKGGDKMPSYDGATGLNLNSMNYEAADLFSKGWQLSIRGPHLLFRSPPNKDGQRLVYMRAVTDYGLSFEQDAEESIEALSRWDSHPAQEKKK
jgi:hypothetical protein